MAKKRAPDVPLPQAVSEIQTIRNCDTATARQIVIDAHQLGDLDLGLRRPDGSTDTQLDRNNWTSPWWSPDLLFENGGLIDAEMRPRPGSLRRVQPMERCRIVIPRESLNQFEKALGPKATIAGEGRAITHLKPLLEHRGDAMSKGEAWDECKQFNVSYAGFENHVWPKARELAGLERKARAGKKPRQPKEIEQEVDQTRGPEPSKPSQPSQNSRRKSRRKSRS